MLIVVGDVSRYRRYKTDMLIVVGDVVLDIDIERQI